MLRFLSLSEARWLEICNIVPGDCAAVSSRSGIIMSWMDLAVNHRLDLSLHFDHLLKNL